MNQQLSKNHYIVIPNFISSYRASKLKEEYGQFVVEHNLQGDEMVSPSSAAHNYIAFLELLTEKTPEVAEILEEPVLPTYAYARVYKNGAELKRHSDRDACEISFTLHLGGDQPWDICIQTPSGEERSVHLNPGDAMMYLGKADHWRQGFYGGQEYSQVFLHYVRSRGDCSYTYFDREKNVSEKGHHICATPYDIDSDIELSVEEEYSHTFDNPPTAPDPNPKVVDTLPKPLYEDYTDTSKLNDNEYVEVTGDEVMEVTDDSNPIIIDDNITPQVNIQKPVIPNSRKSLPVSADDELIHLKTSTKLEEFIQIYENALPIDLCNRILDEYSNSDDWVESTIGNRLENGKGTRSSSVRNSMELGMSMGEIINRNYDVRKKLDDEVFGAVKEVISKFNNLIQRKDNASGFEVEIDTGYNLLKYEKGGFYIQHTDSFKENQRALTCSFQLNDEYEGGELCFFDREIKLKVPTGTAIVFPSNFMYPHEIMPVARGTRYSLVTWLV